MHHDNNNNMLFHAAVSKGGVYGNIIEILMWRQESARARVLSQYIYSRPTYIYIYIITIIAIMGNDHNE